MHAVVHFLHRICPGRAAATQQPLPKTHNNHMEIKWNSLSGRRAAAGAIRLHSLRHGCRCSAATNLRRQHVVFPLQTNTGNHCAKLTTRYESLTLFRMHALAVALVIFLAYRASYRSVREAKVLCKIQTGAGRWLSDILLKSASPAASTRFAGWLRLLGMQRLHPRLN